MRWLVVPLMLSLFGCATMRPSEKLAVGCAVLDVGTTAVGIEQGLREINPALEAEPVVYGIILSVGLHYAFRKLDLPDWAWWSYSGIRCGAGLYNLEKILR